MFRVLSFVSAIVIISSLAAVAVPPTDDKAKKAPGKGSPEEALLQVQVEKGLKVEVWAAEPLLANPVSFSFDEKGRCYVAETTRFGHGVPDTRSFIYWRDDDLACRTVADRLAMYRREYPGHKPYAGFEKYSDQLRMVWDSTGSGKADKSSVFSGGYNRPEDGLAAGVLARKGSVYLACIPDLYLLKDTKGTNTADVKQSLSTGYGVRAQFLGHDLHGLRMGPDGKLYFSIGDRGLHVVTKEGKTISNPDSGAVLRCDPDGGHLELVHIGLRNPQELAFDDHGNLFTFDNNSDSGDRARWVQIVEGGDSGWRCGYQYGSDYHPPGVPQGNRGPWNAEKMWTVPGKDGSPPAFVVPPLANFGNGPSGITHYPGLGLSDRYKDHFFACDFTSSPGSSKIWSLALKPKGASFEVADLHPFVQGMVPTDCDFGPDGAFYWSDWIGGWSPPNRGRIFRLTDPEAMKNPAVAEAKTLLADGFEKRSIEELVKLLEHPHQQVRQEAQFALAASKADTPLAKVAKENKNSLARLHAIWGLGMIGRSHPARMEVLASLTTDEDAEVRSQVVRVIGRLPRQDIPDTLRVKLLERISDPSPRVKYFAAIAAGQAGPLLASRINPVQDWSFFAPFFELLKSNADVDPYLRHAAVVGLVAATGNEVDLWDVWAQSKDKYDAPAVRLGMLLALRKFGSARCGEFLIDPDPQIVAEAARAVHDERIEAAMPKLAALADKSGQPEAVAYRALSASFKLGTLASATAVAKFAARPGEADHVRAFALKLLADWAEPSRRDHVTGMAVALRPRSPAVALDALRPLIADVFRGSNVVRTEAARTAAKLGLKEVGPLMAGLVKDATAPISTRVGALHALDSLNDPSVKEMTAYALASDQPKLRAAGLTVKAKADPVKAAIELPALLKDPAGSVAEKQAAFAALGGMKESKVADQALDAWMQDLIAAKVPAEIQLDVVEAARTRSSSPKLKLHVKLGEKVRAYDDARKKASAKDPLANYQETLAGGDAELGRGIFLNNAAVYCQRCHRLDGQGGDVGPPLNGIAADPLKNRHYLLESIVAPSAHVAKGYETVVLALVDGRTVTGVLKSADAKEVRLMTAEGKELIVPADDIDSKRTGPSAMPDDLYKKLTRRELRDLVEFLASLKEPFKKE